MKWTLFALLFIAVCLTPTGAKTKKTKTLSGQITSRKSIKSILSLHNKERKRHGLKKLKWDAKLAKYAAKSAKEQCKRGRLQHNSAYLKKKKLGENLSYYGMYPGKPSESTLISKGIKGWVDEKKLYNHKKNRCSGVCGHYTQVVWDETTKVGCAAVSKGCRKTGKLNKGYFACNYKKAGNKCGWRPFKRSKSEECLCNSNGARLCG